MKTEQCIFGMLHFFLIQAHNTSHQFVMVPETTKYKHHLKEQSKATKADKSSMTVELYDLFSVL